MNEEDNDLTFVTSHRPALEVGAYKLTATLEIPDYPEGKSLREVTSTFTVQGERFALKPGDVLAVFPPAGSLGDHSSVLPHIILNRSTLPWERDPRAGQAGGDSPVPWLALLLFDEQENPEPKVKKLLDLESGDDTVQFPKLEREAGQDDKDPVTVIDVPVALLKSILPTSSELAYLSHVRQRTAAQGKSTNGAPKAADPQFAVIICSRLPKAGGTSIVHLVSLEGRLSAEDRFDYGDETKPVRLVSLYNWRFACEDDQQDFKNLLLSLKCGLMRLPPLKPDNPDAEAYLKMGCVPLRHTFRGGEAGISWYHGPLLPGENQTEPELLPAGVARCADELVRFDPSLGLFDVSYAAAWELGRLMALQNKTFSTDLFIWKRMVAENIHGATQAKTMNLMTNRAFGAEGTSLELPSTVSTWFKAAANLVGIPLAYLVPDERLLPPESIRFFFLDWLWLKYLLNGAFSIGRVFKDELQGAGDLLDSFLKEKPPKAPVRRIISGFLLRSEVVAGWPGLLVDGSYVDQKGTQVGPNAPLRMDRLTTNILICLFEGELQAVDIHLKPETLHFGVSKPDSEHPDHKWYKVLRKKDGSEAFVAVTFKSGENVIDIDNLVMLSSSLTSAEFAYQMIEGVEKVHLVFEKQG